MRYTIPGPPPSGIAPVPIRNAVQSSSEASSTFSQEVCVRINGPVSPTTSLKTGPSQYVRQICLAMLRRLEEVPDFEIYFGRMNENDPVNSLWNLLREGNPLLVIYNSTRPTNILSVEDRDATQAEKAEIAIFQFIQACRIELEVPPSDRFVIADLLGNDTSQLMKVIHVINYHVLDLAERRGYTNSPELYHRRVAPGFPRRISQNTIVKELITTERMYFSSLKDLQSLRVILIEMGIVPKDIIRRVFFDIEELMECHGPFLEKMERINQLPTSQQKWGALFSEFEERFDIYRPFICNRRIASEAIHKIFDEKQFLAHPRVEQSRQRLLSEKPTYKYILESAMLRPLSRVAKYPLLLREMIKHAQNEDVKLDLIAGYDAAERVLQRINTIVKRELLEEAFEDLLKRMEDWKECDVEECGQLLLHGTFKIATTAVDSQKEYKVYLFERVLICCKETRDEAKGPERRQGSGGKNTKLRLKGRVFTTNIVNITHTSSPGSYTVVVCWKGARNVKDNFTIKFTNEAVMRTWADQLEHQRKEL
ncbi:Dbl homology domain-containing protein [Dactylonectria macrodidyma]|uniref:Dbl homology domain-containing protein n=1 Tax=Dactylonectria macrodidyma TaxID=307937 RepID=A0A9P9JJG9_9HYPO|nr:Dbl homology domain-containing protein [Dactylonectria macrodidyma]